MLDYTPSDPQIQIVKISPEKEKALRDFSQIFLEKINEADRANSDFRRMKLFIETLWNKDTKNSEDIEKKIQSLYIKYKDFSDFNYEYVRFLLIYKGDYETGLNLAKDILDKDEKMRYKIEDEIFMELAVQVVVWNFQEYVLYGLKKFWKDVQKFIEWHRDASNDTTAIENYNKALEYIKNTAPRK
ncbi:MAG: hypothetical protein ACD_78C00334G0004 [uncultured bacterium (gcode 4)]|uniref:Uncharacterized protein n=1 Tax=uncultured bacterium (gcode 4) TaxID=1234023 RepID=K1XXH4_9BACT|nr:MAG: hypothetical protein ACD_78C00334G0004 [uncultured bacterium (gcode 4)]